MTGIIIVRIGKQQDSIDYYDETDFIHPWKSDIRQATIYTTLQTMPKFRDSIAYIYEYKSVIIKD